MKINIITSKYPSYDILSMSAKGRPLDYLFRFDKYNKLIISFDKISYKLFLASLLQKIFRLKYKCLVCGNLDTKFHHVKHLGKVLCSMDCVEKYDNK